MTLCCSPLLSERFVQAIPEVTGGREVASSEVLPEAEPIGSLLWRLSELQAQLQAEHWAIGRRKLPEVSRF